MDLTRERTLSFLGHLEEFRSRLIISIAAIGVTTVLAYTFSDTILNILRSPAGNIQLTAFNPMDGFMIRFRVALYGGIALATPVWIYQLLRFIEPGLLPSEKKFILPYAGAMVGLFLLGTLFGYSMLGYMMKALFAMFGNELAYLPSADRYISFVIYFLLATGLAFEMPIIILLLVKMRIVSPEAFKKQRKFFYFGIFVAAEMITPVADPIVGPMIVMVPMILLFEIALLATRYVVPKRV